MLISRAAGLLLLPVVAAETCRLYIAKSHFYRDDNPKFGLFAGVDFRQNETLPNPEIGIPLVDIAIGNYMYRENFELYNAIIQFLEGKVWMSSFAGMQWEGNHTTTLFSPGVGTIANHHSGYYNIDWFQAGVLLRERQDGVVEEGKASPGRGAFTNYFNLTMRAVQNIPAGMELFANLGDVFDDDREDLYQDRINRLDYDEAEDILAKIATFMSKYEKEMKGSFQQDVLDFILDTMVEEVGGKRGKVLRSLLPQTPAKVRKAIEAGGAFMYRNRDLVKSIEWLETHGLCVDYLRSGTSTIPHAGRGAFASRSFKEGDLIAPMPMIPILAEDILDMFMITEYTDEGGQVGITYDRERPIGQQLLTNYAFGHAESSLLMVPTSPMVNLINHASSPNARIMWSAHDHVGFDHGIHDIDFREWNMAEVDPQLIFLLIADRDIQEGEEIFIDYGPSWEDAWQEHLIRFDEYLDTAGVVWPRRSEDARVEFKNKPYPTDLKRKQIPYPPSSFTACFLETDTVADGQPKDNAEGQEIFQWVGPKSYEDFEGQSLMVCDLQSSQFNETSGYTYTVLTRFKGSTDIVEVKGVPHSAIILLEKPYMSDMHTFGAFRHWIEIPDEMFPQAWRDLRP